MKSLTVFRAYKRAIELRCFIERARGRGRKGIRVDTDDDARQWRRRERQAVRFSLALERTLQERGK
jgi:hypothetical protein